MSSAAVTLQCPACGGVFLTLQQGTGGVEICPHCSISAPRGQFRAFELPSGPGSSAPLQAEHTPAPATVPTAPFPPPEGMQPPLPPAADPLPVWSEKIPLPPVEPGALPLPSRVLQTREPSSWVDAQGNIHSLPPTPEQTPVPAGYAPAPAYAPPPAPSSPAAVAKASPAQLWEAAILQRHQAQAQAPVSTFTGGELPTADTPASFQEPPPPPPPLLAPPPAPVTPESYHQAAAVAPPLPPPQIGFDSPTKVTATAKVAPPASLLHSQPHSLPQPPPRPVVVPVSPFGIASAVPAADPAEPAPLPAPPGLSVHIAPPLPGVTSSHEPTIDPHGYEVTEHGTLTAASHAHAPPHPAQDLALVAAKMVRNSGPPTITHHPRKRVPWIAALIFGSLALAGGLHVTKNFWEPKPSLHTSTLAIAQPVPTSPATSQPEPESTKAVAPLPPPEATASTENGSGPASAPTPVSSTTSEQTPSPTPEVVTTPPATPKAQDAPMTTAVSTEGLPPAPPSEAVATLPVPTVPPPPPAPAAPQEEVRRAMPSDAATLSISKQDSLPVIAAKLVFGIDTATTPEERARWIADPEKHSSDMERFVRMHGGRLQTREVEPLPIPGPVHALPSGEVVTLFRVNSPASRGGAMVRLHATANGNHVIDWTLFAQTYDNAFDRFVATARVSPEEAEWYTVLCSLSSNPNTKNAREEAHLMLKVQGSLAETGVTEAWVDKNSPVGRYLQKEMAPGRTYLIELQFGTSDTDSRCLKVLDCVATMDEPAQANANK